MADKTIIEKIQQLLAIAGDKATSENEATLAYTQAQKLMHKHAIEQWQLEGGSDKTPNIIERAVRIEHNRNDHDRCQIAAAVAKANRCATYLSCRKFRNGVKRIETIVFVGVEQDVERCIMLWQSMDLYCASHWRRARRLEFEDWQARNHVYDRSFLNYAVPEAAFRNGFYLGFLDRIQERFEELSKELEATEPGRELVSLRESAVDERMRRLNLGKARWRGRKASAEGFDRGRSAADQVGVGSAEVAAAA